MNYLQQIAEHVRAHIDPDVLPDQNVDALMLVYAVLVRSKGTGTELSDVHDAWAAWMSAIEPNHPSVVPFEQLAAEVQAEDRPFLDAVLAVAREISAAGGSSSTAGR